MRSATPLELWHDDRVPELPIGLDVCDGAISKSKPRLFLVNPIRRPSLAGRQAARPAPVRHPQQDLRTVFVVTRAECPGDPAPLSDPIAEPGALALVPLAMSEQGLPDALGEAVPLECIAVRLKERRRSTWVRPSGRPGSSNSNLPPSANRSARSATIKSRCRFCGTQIAPLMTLGIIRQIARLHLPVAGSRETSGARRAR